MNDKTWIESLRGQKHTDLSLEQAQDVQKMIVDGDLRHIDSDFIKALADLAETGGAEYLGLNIERRRSGGDWRISAGGDGVIVDSAIEALMLCEDHRDPYKPAQLREPEPPTFDEALAAKCEAQAREDEARELKGMV